MITFIKILFYAAPISMLIAIFAQCIPEARFVAPTLLAVGILCGAFAALLGVLEIAKGDIKF